MQQSSDQPRRFRFLGEIIRTTRAFLLSAFLANVASAVPPGSIPPTVEVPADQFLSVPEPVPFVSDDGAWCDVAVVDGVPWAYAIAGRAGEESARVGVFARIRAVPASAAGHVAIPDSFEGVPVTAIDGMAFYGCDRLVSVVVPDGVESIGDYAFYGCAALESISLPESATNIAATAFEGCPLLSSSTDRFRAVSSAAPPEDKDGSVAENAVCAVSFDANGGSVGVAMAERSAKEVLGRTDAAPWQPVFRFYSKNYRGHFYTIDEEEMRTVRDTNPNWKYEGVAYYAAKTQLAGMVPLHRFYSKNYRGHFYTIDEEEMRTVRDTNPNWKYEGIAFFVYPYGDSDPNGTATPVFRFWSKAYRHHFYTISETEMKTIRDTNPNWQYENVAFWTQPPPRYDVVFDANAATATGTMASQSFFFGEVQELRRNAFALPGHVFAGWAKSPTGPKVYDDGQRVSNLTAVAGGKVMLYAVWTKIPLYMVVNLSLAGSYLCPVTYLAEPPPGGFNTDEYKTTKLVLRRLEPGPVPRHPATITKPFYIGLFEVTQRQWELMTGTRPSYFSNDAYYATRPVENLSYDMIRGSSRGAQWPASNDVDSGTFLSELRLRTGLDFDLPTEAQWEYACRAGTTTSYNSGKNNREPYQDSAMDEVGRYWYNGDDPGRYFYYEASEADGAACTTASGTAAVGSYLPNAWGLYDMHGNVFEWCLDWESNSVAGNDPVGPSSGSRRMMRGGAWHSYAKDCTSSYKAPSPPRYEWNSSGFRLVAPLSQE